MRSVPFWKVQSIGNHFPLIHIADIEALGVANIDKALEDLSIQMGQAHYGVGGDGLLAMERTSQPGAVRLRMFNLDGTEDFCGNGLRCAALHAQTVGWVGEAFMIEHLGHSVPCVVMPDRICTLIGKATYEPALVPVTASEEVYQQEVYPGIVGSALTTGSTHVVIPVSALPGDAEFFDLGPKIENFEKYPQRTSVIWVQEVEDRHIRLRIWERGVGETFGCGTGSSAAAADYLRRHHEGGTVQVDNPGGTIEVSMGTWDGEISITGQAEHVFSGSFGWADGS